MKFKQFITELHKVNPNPAYYHQIVQHAKLILVEIALRNQGVVARDLGMSTTKLSTIKPLLIEYAKGQ